VGCCKTNKKRFKKHLKKKRLTSQIVGYEGRKMQDAKVEIEAW
jgi:hypothetical protein